MDNDQYEPAFTSDDPVQHLRAMVKKQIDAGHSQAALLIALDQYRRILAAQNREQDEDVVLEVMDFLAGWCSPHMRM